MIISRSSIHDVYPLSSGWTYRGPTPWLPHEDRVLLDLYYNEGATMKVLSYVLRRSPDSIRSRFRRLGIRQKAAGVYA